MTGQVTCDPTDLRVTFFVQVIQAKGRQVVSGFAFPTENCPVGGGVLSWSVTVSTTQGQTFQKGSATAFVTAQNATFTSTQSVSGPIKLTG